MYQISPAAHIFTHTYMKPIQHGIQAAHVIADLCTMFEDDSEPDAIVHSWANDVKVIKILDGGGENFSQVKTQCELWAKHFGLPYTAFYEPDFHNQCTAFGFILPADFAQELEKTQELHDVYKRAVAYRTSTTESESDLTGLEKQVEFIDFITSFHSAR